MIDWTDIHSRMSSMIELDRRVSVAPMMDWSD
jgi:tRNA-dihydrouridine synthase